MALDNIEQLEQFVSLEDGQTLKDLLSSEEIHQVKLKDNLLVMTKEDKEVMIGNYKSDFETAGREKLLKELRDTTGLEYEGVKDPINFINNLSAKVKAEALKEANINPDKKVEELAKDLDKVRALNSEWEKKYVNLENSFNTREKQRDLDNKIMSLIPDKTLLPKEDLLTLFKTKYSVENVDNNMVVKRGEEILKDELARPLTIDKIVNDFSANYIQKVDGGSGQGDSAGNHKQGSYEQFAKEMKDKGASSLEINREMAKRIQDGTLKM